MEGLIPIVHGDELANDMVHCVIQFGADAKKWQKCIYPREESIINQKIRTSLYWIELQTLLE